mgnify:FL=1
MQALEKITYSNNWITIVLLLLFASIVLLKLIDSRRLKESFFAFFNFNLIEDEDVEATSFFDTFQIVIFVFSVTSLSLLTYNFKLYKLSESSDSFASFSSLFIGILFYFLIKRMLEHLLLLLFLIKKGLQSFVTSKTNYLYNISFLLYIALILCEYGNINRVYLFYFATFLFIIRFVFILVRNKKLIFNKLFYFILYICALEIAPLFVLFKLMF